MGRCRRLTLALLVVVLGLLACPPAHAADDVPTTTTIDVQGGGLYGDDLVLTATVTSGAGVPTGSVQFYDGAEPMGAPVSLSDAGTATHTSSAIVGLHSYRAEFVGAGGFGPSQASAFHATIASGMVLHAQPTILAPGLHPTLTLSSYAEDTSGRPAVGEELTFSVLGHQPNPFDLGGGKVVCRAVTDSNGFASCRGRGLIASLLTLLGAPSYVSHPITTNYGWSVDVAPVIKLS